jgi:hypothetical protein
VHGVENLAALLVRAIVWQDHLSPDRSLQDCYATHVEHDSSNAQADAIVVAQIVVMTMKELRMRASFAIMNPFLPENVAGLIELNSP